MDPTAFRADLAQAEVLAGSPPPSPPQSDFGFSFGSSHHTQDAVLRDDQEEPWRESGLLGEVTSLREQLSARDAVVNDLSSRVGLLGSSVDCNAEEQANSAKQLLEAIKDLRAVAESVGQEVVDLRQSSDKRDLACSEMLARVNVLSNGVDAVKEKLFLPVQDLTQLVNDLRTVVESNEVDITALKGAASGFRERLDDLERRAAIATEHIEQHLLQPSTEHGSGDERMKDTEHDIESLPMMSTKSQSRTTPSETRETSSFTWVQGHSHSSGRLADSCESSCHMHDSELSNRVDRLETLLGEISGSRVSEIEATCARLTLEAAMCDSKCDSVAQRLETTERSFQDLAKKLISSYDQQNGEGTRLSGFEGSARLTRRGDFIEQFLTKEIDLIQSKLLQTLQDRLGLEQAQREELRNEFYERFHKEKKSLELHQMHAAALEESLQQYDSKLGNCAELYDKLAALEKRMCAEIFSLTEQITTERQARLRTSEGMHDFAAFERSMRQTQAHAIGSPKYPQGKALVETDQMAVPPAAGNGKATGSRNASTASELLPREKVTRIVAPNFGEKSGMSVFRQEQPCELIERTKLLQERHHKTCQDFLKQAHVSLARVLQKEAHTKIDTKSRSISTPGSARSFAIATETTAGDSVVLDNALPSVEHGASFSKMVGVHSPRRATHQNVPGANPSGCRHASVLHSQAPLSSTPLPSDLPERRQLSSSVPHISGGFIPVLGGIDNGKGVSPRSARNDLGETRTFVADGAPRLGNPVGANPLDDTLLSSAHSAVARSISSPSTSPRLDAQL